VAAIRNIAIELETMMSVPRRRLATSCAQAVRAIFDELSDVGAPLVPTEDACRSSQLALRKSTRQRFQHRTRHI